MRVIGRRIGGAILLVPDDADMLEPDVMGLVYFDGDTTASELPIWNTLGRPGWEEVEDESFDLPPGTETIPWGPGSIARKLPGPRMTGEQKRAENQARFQAYKEGRGKPLNRVTPPRGLPSGPPRGRQR